MPKLRRLSGDEVIAILESIGFAVQSQRGSHVKLRRMDAGTLRAIFRQASRFIPEDQLYPRFYSD